MSTAERELRSDIESFATQSLDRIAVCGVQPVSDWANATRDAIDSSEIFVKSAVSARLVTMGMTLIPGFSEPIVVLNVNPALSNVESSIDADTVRTLAILHQFHSSDFDRRFVDIYKDAYKVQSYWVEETGAGFAVHDPRRYADPESLTRSLMGQYAYYNDFGFDDWRNAIFDADEFLRKEHSEMKDVNRRHDALAEMTDDRNAFILGREDFLGLFAPNLPMEKAWIAAKMAQTADQNARTAAAGALVMAVGKRITEKSRPPLQI